jgi:integrating conjugative element protein (TIGR03758 family)
MAASPASQAAFSAATGKTMGAVATVIMSVVAILVLLWAAWLVLSQYRLWAKDEGDLEDVIWSAIRAVIVILLVTSMF